MAEAVLDRHIEITPGVRNGKPRIAGTRITVADVVLMRCRLGMSLEEIAGKYDLSLASVYAAISYYYDHQSEIDQSIQEGEALADSFRSENPSLLQEKLKALVDDLAAITEFSDEETGQEVTDKQVGKKTSGRIVSPDELQARLRDDAAKMPHCTESELGQALITFAYRIIDQFNLSPKDVSDELHESDDRRIATPPVEYSYGLTEFKRVNRYDTATALYRLSLFGLHYSGMYKFNDWSDMLAAVEAAEGEMKRRA